MNIQYSPVVGGEKIEYQFSGEKVQVDGKIYDLSSVEKDKRYDVPFPLVDVYRGSDGDLEVTLIQYHRADAPEEEKFPKLFTAEDSELDDLAAIELEEIVEIETVSEELPSETELLELQIEALAEKNQMYEQAIMELAMSVYK